MDANAFQSVEVAIDRIDAVVYGMIDRDSPDMRAIREAVAELSRKLGGERSASIGLRLIVNDRTQARQLPIDILTFTSDRGEEAYDSTEECSSQRYRVETEQCVVPRDRCPRCWKDWAHKFQNTECPHCRLRLGADCMVIAEDDQCPQCEDGVISGDALNCGECGFSLDAGCVERQQIRSAIDSHRGLAH